MKEKQKIFNYDTLWDNALKGWYYELYYYYNEYLKFPKNDEFLLKNKKRELYNKLVEFEEFTSENYGYVSSGEFLMYCSEDLKNIYEEFSEDENLHNISQDYFDLYYNYSEFLLMFGLINEIDYYDISPYYI